MEVGIKGKKSIIVTKELTAEVMGSGELAVFATPAMIALMEETAYKSVAPYLEEGQGTVGTLINVEHISATPVGMEVICETELIETDRKSLTFKVTAKDEKGTIGEGIHKRFIIDNKRFTEKAEAKKV